VAVIVEEEAPAAVTLLSMVMVQVTWNPAPVGKAGGSHPVAAGAVAAEATSGTPANPARTSMARAIAATTETISRRRRMAMAVE
jgi:hypothetical protein